MQKSLPSYTLQLPYEAVDKITTDNLTEVKTMLQEENNKTLVSAKKNSLSDSQKKDFEYNAALITHINEVLKYFKIN